MDAITLLKEDHKTVEALFKRYEATGPRAYAARRRLVDQMIRELSVHAEIEEMLFYPSVREAVGDTEQQVLESLEEHHLVKVALAELEETQPQDERFDAKVRVLMENVRHHVKEEETDLFPRVRRAVTASSLRELGERMAEAKKTVPDRPHPNAPDTPPGNVVSGMGAVLVDRAKDAASGIARRATGRSA